MKRISYTQLFCFLWSNLVPTEWNILPAFLIIHCYSVYENSTENLSNKLKCISLLIPFRGNVKFPYLWTNLMYFNHISKQKALEVILHLSFLNNKILFKFGLCKIDVYFFMNTSIFRSDNMKPLCLHSWHLNLYFQDLYYFLGFYLH